MFSKWHANDQQNTLTYRDWIENPHGRTDCDRGSVHDGFGDSDQRIFARSNCDAVGYIKDHLSGVSLGIGEKLAQTDDFLLRYKLLTVSGDSQSSQGRVAGF